MTFGAGIHHCLGANLARAELEEALTFLPSRMPSLRMTEPPHTARFKASTSSTPCTWPGARTNRASDRRKSQRPATALAKERAKMTSVTPTTNTMALPLG